MIRRLLREYYLLPPGEQRALLMLSLLVIFTLGFRVLSGMLPQEGPAGLEQFKQEAKQMLISLEKADSLQRIHSQDGTQDRTRDESSPGRNSGTASVYPVLDLNKADSTALLMLPGIGPVFAGRIVKYRSLLGGYFELAQLSEVYGLRRETIDRIEPFLVIEGNDLEKLPVNSSSFRELLKHPYLEYEHVKALVQYMDREGSIDCEEDIRSNRLLPDSSFVRIAPYLDFMH